MGWGDGGEGEGKGEGGEVMRINEREWLWLRRFGGGGM